MTQMSRLLLAILAVSVAATACGRAGASAPVAHSSPAPSSSVAGVAERSIAFQGVTMTLPTGWTVARPECGQPATHTVVIGTWTGSCPAQLPTQATTSVRLTSDYGRQFALGWTGHRVTWHGQSAWLTQTTQHGLTSVTLTLPWLNTIIDTQSGDAADARSLLRQFAPRLKQGLAVPTQASSVSIQSLAGVDGDHQHRDATITKPIEILRLLSDLKALSPIKSVSRACNGSWWPSTALLTVRAAGHSRTYAARFDSCGLVIGGTGSADRTSQRLHNDVERLVPNSNL
jgi:hypothetical protein